MPLRDLTLEQLLPFLPDQNDYCECVSHLTGDQIRTRFGVSMLRLPMWSCLANKIPKRVDLNQLWKITDGDANRAFSEHEKKTETSTSMFIGHQDQRSWWKYSRMQGICEAMPAGLGPCTGPFVRQCPQALWPWVVPEPFCEAVPAGLGHLHEPFREAVPTGTVAVPSSPPSLSAPFMEQ